jgi:hypothetical protein
MPFEKGCKRAPTAGRKPGQSNKNTAEVKALAMKDVPHVLKELSVSRCTPQTKQHA